MGETPLSELKGGPRKINPAILARVTQDDLSPKFD